MFYNYRFIGHVWLKMAGLLIISGFPTLHVWRGRQQKKISITVKSVTLTEQSNPGPGAATHSYTHSLSLILAQTHTGLLFSHFYTPVYWWNAFLCPVSSMGISAVMKWVGAALQSQAGFSHPRFPVRSGWEPGPSSVLCRASWSVLGPYSPWDTAWISYPQNYVL